MAVWHTSIHTDVPLPHLTVINPPHPRDIWRAQGWHLSLLLSLPLPFSCPGAWEQGALSTIAQEQIALFSYSQGTRYPLYYSPCQNSFHGITRKTKDHLMPKYILFLLKHWGWGDNLVNRMLTMQAWRPEFEPSETRQKSGCGNAYLDPSNGEVETGLVGQPAWLDQ